MEKIYLSNTSLTELKNTTVFTRVDLEDMEDSLRVISATDQSQDERYIDNLTIRFQPKSVAWNIEHEVGFPCIRLIDDGELDMDSIEDRRSL